jgi:hypothetical protein
VAIPQDKRWCFWVPVGQFDERGYIPSVVIEGENGHHPLTGNGAFAQPWYIGKTYDQAKQTCADWNEEAGISVETALEIVMSMMRQGLRR